MRGLVLVLVLVISVSCRKDPEVIKPSIIPTEIQSTYNAFFNEASLRGYNIKKKYVKFVLIHDTYFYSGESDPANEQILIDTSSLKYKLWKEALIFHEMGHYFLNRGHRDSTFKNITDDPVSIMNCCMLPDYTNTLGNYSYKRYYYINELFNQNTAYPDWLKTTQSP